MFITNIWSIIKLFIHSFSYSLDGVFSCYQSLYLSQLCDVVWGLVRLKGNEKNGLSQQSLQSNLLPNLLNNDHFYLICQQLEDKIKKDQIGLKKLSQLIFSFESYCIVHVLLILFIHYPIYTIQTVVKCTSLQINNN